jgi:hypothetical protein
MARHCTVPSNKFSLIIKKNITHQGRQLKENKKLEQINNQLVQMIMATEMKNNGTIFLIIAEKNKLKGFGGKNKQVDSKMERE